MASEGRNIQEEPHKLTNGCLWLHEKFVGLSIVHIHKAIVLNTIQSCNYCREHKREDIVLFLIPGVTQCRRVED
jgi:hypothetical protein